MVAVAPALSPSSCGISLLHRAEKGNQIVIVAGLQSASSVNTFMTEIIILTLSYYIPSNLCRYVDNVSK